MKHTKENIIDFIMDKYESLPEPGIKSVTTAEIFKQRLCKLPYEDLLVMYEMYLD